MHNNLLFRPTRSIRFYLTAVMAGLRFLLSFNAHATHDISKNYNGKVIEGFDAVAYFTMGEAVKGSSDISIGYLGGTWLFVNEQHRELFLANPGK